MTHFLCEYFGCNGDCYQEVAGPFENQEDALKYFTTKGDVTSLKPTFFCFSHTKVIRSAVVNEELDNAKAITLEETASKIKYLAILLLGVLVLALAVDIFFLLTLWRV